MKRILSAVFLSGIFFSVVGFGNEWVFLIFINLFIALGMYELYSMYEKRDKKCLKGAGIAFGCLLSLGFFFKSPFIIFSTGTGSLVILFLSGRWRKNAVFERIYHTVFGIVYVSWLGSHFILLRNADSGQLLVCFVFLLVCMDDTAAFYVGKSIGKHLLAPTISPKKTIEGSAGGIVGSIAVALIAGRWLQLSIGHCIALGIFGSVFGQIGDLVESAIKRSLDQKDSGTLIPGHGGVLDRIDSSLFAAPVIYYYLVFL